MRLELSLLGHFLMALDGVRNFRPVLQSLCYRSASFDNLSDGACRKLLTESSPALHGSSLAAIIDLRNTDEILKGQAERIDAAHELYRKFQSHQVTRDGRVIVEDLTTLLDGDGDFPPPRLYHAPLLDPDAFWDEAIERLPPGMRIQSTLRTVFEGGALDRAAARHLEDRGLGLLYSIMLATAGPRIGAVVRICAEEMSRGAVVFHCAKGKDRTGVIAMLMEVGCLGLSEDEVVSNYAASGALLGGEDARAPYNEKYSRKTTTTIDWSRFRGSPESAMRETLDWIHSTHGSVDTYLDSVGVTKEQRTAVALMASQGSDSQRVHTLQ